MPQMIISLFLVCSATLVGVAAGWCLCAASQRRSHRSEPNETQFARDVLVRLHEVAAHMAADVDVHASRVEAINGELHSTDPQDSGTVLQVVERLVQANTEMQEQLASADARLRDQARQIEIHTEAARTDALTGLANRRALDDELAHRIAEFERQGKEFSLVLFDIDHFKAFNDNYGHQAGDAVLRGLAGLVRAHVRDVDLPARYGGEEFALVIPGLALTDAGARAEKTRRAVEMADFQFGDVALQVKASFGVAHAQPGETAESLIRRADTALYSSKKTGRNRVHLHDGKNSVAFPPPEKKVEAPAPAPVKKPVEHAPPPTPQPCPDEPGWLCDRDAFRTTVGRRLAEWKRGGSPMSILLVRVDKYPELAAELGEHCARAMMRATARFLHAAVRDMDLLAYHDQATFGVLLPQAEPAATVVVAERLRTAISQCSLPLGGRELSFSVSLGGATAEPTDDVPRLMQRAAESLDSAVKSGGNCCYYHNGQWSEIGSALLARLADAPLPAPPA